MTGLLTCATSWVLHGSSMKSLTRQLASEGEGVVDFCGFDGHAVSGIYYAKALQAAQPEMDVRLKYYEGETEGEVYRFGGGTSRAVGRAGCNMQLCGAEGPAERFEWDLVPGVLPLLLGRAFGAEIHAWVDIAKGEVWSVGTTGQTQRISQSARDGVMRMSLRGRVQTADYREAISAVLVAQSAQHKEDVEQDQVSATTVSADERDQDDMTPESDPLSQTLRDTETDLTPDETARQHGTQGRAGKAAGAEASERSGTAAVARGAQEQVESPSTAFGKENPPNPPCRLSTESAPVCTCFVFPACVPALFLALRSAWLRFTMCGAMRE